MSLDDDILAAAREGFEAEAAELLQQFEQALLAMEQQPDDAEALNTAFRAAHTMKGTAGLFGFDGLVGFTHEVESLLDDLRAGDAVLGDEVMAVLLESGDQLAALLRELNAPEPAPDTTARSQALGDRLRALRRAPPSPATATAAAAEAAATTPAGERLWRIQLAMGADALRNGLDPLSFIRYLGTLGRIERVETDTRRVPSLAELDPESCLLDFDILLASARERAEVVSTFDFLADDCTLAVSEAAEAGAGSPPDLDAETPAPDTEAAEPFIERRGDGSDRRDNAPERRQGGRRADDTRFIRVRADKLDLLVDLIGELVIASSGAQMVAQAESSARFTEAAARIHDLVQNARDGALALRMVPIGESFARFHRVVRDVSKELGKDVELLVTGGDTEMDKSMVEVIGDPLMHLVRNSLDHGLETTEARIAAGKPARGRLGVHAYQESGSIVIEVSDDGRGLNRDRILAKAIERGLVAPDAALADDAIHQLIFAPGFSTAETVTNLSGRGVGMDVVKRNVEGLRGQIRVATTPGVGTTVQIRLPLTLAIINGFLTSVGGVSYVLPLELVAECLDTPPECGEEPTRVAGHFDLRGEIVPWLDLGRFYRHPAPPPGRRSLVLVHDGQQRVGLVVDRLLGEHQTVIKPLAHAFRHIRGLAGSTILGSGEVALVLDVPALLQQAVAQLTAEPAPAH